jgi:tRNA A-37 threonylcarbamoyl transferase component Bud32
MKPPATTNDCPARELAAPVLVKAGGVHWRVRSTAVAEALTALLQDPESVFARKETLIHDTWLVTVARVNMPATLGGQALMRRSNYAKRHARWRDFFRTAGPLRAFDYALALERAGLPTPRVLAAGTVRRLNIPQRGYLLVEEIASAVTLAKLAQQATAIPPGTARRVATVIAHLHEQGFMHGDLTINNVLLDAQGKPWFIDLERGRRVNRALNWRQTIEDFHRFARHVGKFTRAGRRQAFRLLVEYCTARGWPGREREFAEALKRRLKHKVALDSRTGS